MLLTYSQNFEGQVTYKTTLQNPNPDLINAFDFKKKYVNPGFGKQGFMLQQYFYKKNRFMGIQILNFKSSFELYDPENKKLYKWEKGAKKGTVFNTNESIRDDKLVKFLETNEVASILNVRCKKAVFKFKKAGEVEVWYNPDCLKVNKEFYKDFKIDFKDIFYEKLGCMPFRVKIGIIITEIFGFEDKEIPDEVFHRPDIKFVKYKN